jgi:hypothetical protein
MVLWIMAFWSFMSCRIVFINVWFAPVTSIALKMEAIRNSEMLAATYKIRLHRNPEVHNQYFHRREYVPQV